MQTLNSRDDENTEQKSEQGIILYNHRLEEMVNLKSTVYYFHCFGASADELLVYESIIRTLVSVTALT
jgi:hypothetical protein